MAKEKKQLRELSEEELKNVTGGYLVYVEPGLGDLVPVTPFNPNIKITPDANGECPDGFVPSTDESGAPVCVSE